jgi:hypothetical protein
LQGRRAVRLESPKRDHPHPQFVDVLALVGEVLLDIVVEPQCVALHLIRIGLMLPVTSMQKTMSTA